MARAAQLRSTSRLRRNAGRGDGKGSLSHGHPIGNGSALDALAFLNRDHRELAELFDRYALARRTLAAPERRALALKICTALTLHARLEDELFYPTVRKNVSGVDELINDASVEHATIKSTPRSRCWATTCATTSATSRTSCSPRSARPTSICASSAPGWPSENPSSPAKRDHRTDMAAPVGKVGHRD